MYLFVIFGSPHLSEISATFYVKVTQPSQTRRFKCLFWTTPRGLNQNVVYLGTPRGPQYWGACDRGLGVFSSSQKVAKIKRKYYVWRENPSWSVKRCEKLFREIGYFLLKNGGISSRIYPISTLRVSTGTILLSKPHFSTRNLPITAHFVFHIVFQNRDGFYIKQRTI